jgi:hypothetical protein
MKPPSENAPTPRSPIGCGCGAAMALALAVVMGLAWFSYSRGRRFEKELQDPAAREARSREILGYRALPEGYHPLGGFSVPFIQDMAMLSDREPEPGEELSGPADAFGRRGFIYLEARSSDDRAREVEAYFEGKSEHSAFFQDVDERFAVEEALGRGHLRAGGAEVRYVAERGRMTLRGEELPTILARLLMVCPEQTRLRVAMWFEPPPEEAAPPSGGAEGAAPLAGTPADPAALRRFLDHFRLCG